MNRLSVQVKVISSFVFTMAALIVLHTAVAQQGCVTPAQPSTQLSNGDQIMMTVTVVDKYGRYVSMLNRNAFTVLDEKTPQGITFFNDKDMPISIGILIDVSGSMSNPFGKSNEPSLIGKGLSRFIRSSNRSNEYFLMIFNKSPQLLLDTTRDSNAVLAALDNLKIVQPKRLTALYDACYVGIEKVSRGIHQKHAILLISDGSDNSSRYNFSELRRLQKESDVLIYTIYIPAGDGPLLALKGEARDVLDDLAISSGATRFAPRNREALDAVFERIALELRHQYTIGFKAVPSIDGGKWHRLKVKITLPSDSASKVPRLLVRSREGYYALTKPH